MKPVNLLPTKHRPRAAQGPRRGSANVALGVLGVLLVMAVVYVLAANQVNTRKSETAKLTAEAAQAEAEAGQLGSFGEFAQIKETRVASIKQLSEARVDWERVMRETAHVLPSGVSLTKVEAAATGGTTSASSGDAQPSTGAPEEAGPQGPSIRLVGCADRQRDVADMLVRLRQLHQENEVKLVESKREKEDAGGGNPAAGVAGADAAAGGGEQSCAPNFKFELTVDFAEDTSAKQAQEGPAQIPSRLGGGS